MTKYLIQSPDDPNERVLTESLDGYEEWAVLPDDPFQNILESRRNELWEAVKGIRFSKLAAAPTEFGPVQADVESRANLTGLALDYTFAVDDGNGDSWAEPFTLADNTVRLFTGPEMKIMARQVATYVKMVHGKARSLKSKIYSYDLEQLEALNIEEGWP